MGDDGWLEKPTKLSDNSLVSHHHQQERSTTKTIVVYKKCRIIDNVLHRFATIYVGNLKERNVRIERILI